MDHFDFDTYKGTEDERTITCDTYVIDGKVKTIPDNEKEYCTVTDDYPSHGMMAASVAGGTIFGAAKKANIHMIATSYSYSSSFEALDYIKRHGKPHKSVISFSSGGFSNYDQHFQDKINEVTEAGYIIFASGGNQNKELNKDKKNFRYYAEFDNVIGVGSTEDTYNKTITNGYKVASYSNYGKSIDIFASGDVEFATHSGKDRNNEIIGLDGGTSASAPIAAGVAATLMSESPNVKWNYELMLNKLLDLSLKDVLDNLKSENTPNRLLNNGKRTVYSPVNVYNGCGITSGGNKCNNGCCSKDGIEQLTTQKSFDIYKTDDGVSAVYRTWHITSKTEPSYLYLSKAEYGNDGEPSEFCLDLGEYLNGEGYNFLSIVKCSDAKHKFKYGGTHSKTIDIYNKNNVHLTDKNGSNLCLYYSMTPRISKCDYIDNSSNKNAEHMKWDVFYL
ncbi:hypothetical protein PIROE2DRAFT_64014 [Piromyces sp. E2]|nr:hypothetical protein PIROE2DRAFT_64014 [Piromyces sp. E2]|eukprot:OUM59072.1 hypothetical protein PIROE2DRAFT_64014 [Piromyces sp. E2]